MNYIREAENYLYHYGDMYKSIENMDREISRLIRNAGPKDLTGISYDNIGSGQTSQDDAYNTLFEIQRLTQSRKETKEKLNKIDILLDDLNEEVGCEFFGQVLRKWYIEKIPKEEIANDIGYSSRQSIYTLKGKAIRKFAIRLFGIKPLRML